MVAPADKKPALANASDADEDLDDLDDVLDQFNQPQSPAGLVSPPAPPPTGSGTATNFESTDEVDEDELSQEFSKELAKEMESLMRELSGGSLSGDAMGDASQSNKFQNKIQQAMDKLRQSESNLKAESTSKNAASFPDGTPESLQALFSSLKDFELGDGEVPEDDAELAGLLENMMGQLMSKEVLYDPLKELLDTFPPYLENPPAPLSGADRKRYESQLTCVRKILVIYDDSAYSDDNVAMKNSVSELMNELQTYGSPPSEVMGPLPPGMTLGPDGLPQGEGCIIA